MKLTDKIYVSGHNGMVGSAIVRELERLGFKNIVVKSRKELDLRNQQATEDFFSHEKPDYVFIASAVVGSIWANMHGHAHFLMDNLKIQCNLIESAYKNDVKKLLFLGSSCIYPKDAPQPLSESSLFAGSLEPTNEGYAIAKIAGLKLCEYYSRQYDANFISLMPCNLYGYNDNFDPIHSHILPALIRKFHEAKLSQAESVSVWGTGKVYRELLFGDDLAKACIFAMENYSDPEFLNVGYGEDFTITEIANMVKDAAGYEGDIIYDSTKPEGTFRRILDSSKIRALGWKPEFGAQEGIKLTYDWYVSQGDCARRIRNV